MWRWKKKKSFFFAFFLFLIGLSILITLTAFKQIELLALLAYGFMLPIICINLIIKEVKKKYFLKYLNIVGYTFFIILEMGFLIWPTLAICYVCNANYGWSGIIVALCVYVFYLFFDRIWFLVYNKENKWWC